ncbi:MAG: hypothetical protein Q8Q49_01650 [bacterium]|nr:hypothetical protein [bacterium]
MKASFFAENVMHERQKHILTGVQLPTSAILGAGFSRCANLPTQKEFSDYLLSDELSVTPLQKSITQVIKHFLRDVFSWRERPPMPSLEDYFTCIDISANSGHHLGIQYTPKKLRAIRRMTIHRIFQILDRKYNRSDAIDTFLSNLLRTNSPGFVVTNWDIVLERGLQYQDASNRIDYGFECFNWRSKQRKTSSADDITVAKLHGSSNWVYCENCSTIFYDLDEKLALHKMIGLIKADFRLFAEEFNNQNFDDPIGDEPESRKCPLCGNMLATHIATFSFRKSYRTFAYPAIWHNAQTTLSKSSQWIFVGYSLPDADFEFKHLLKTAELAFRRRRDAETLNITVVLKDDEAAESRFRAFFGERVHEVIQGGLQEFVM